MNKYNTLDFESRRRLLTGLFGKELVKTISKSTAVLEWFDPSSETVPAHGSMFFADTGIEAFILAITARHVYEAYTERSGVNPNLKCQINDLPFSPHARRISLGRDADLATFWLTRAELQILERITIPWPPLIPQVGQDVLLAGMPGIAKTYLAPRTYSEPHQVAFGVYTRLATVNSVNDRDISMVKPPNEFLLDIAEKGLPPPGYDMGGMSGGPVAIIQDAEIVSWAISGVIYECNSTCEIVKAARADVIEPNGRIST